jgi:hypothetical protein
MLTQKDEQGDECLISFMSTNLQGAELNYPVIDKQEFIVYKVHQIVQALYFEEPHKDNSTPPSGEIIVDAEINWGMKRK